MECTQCHQVSDWIGDQSAWTAVNERNGATHALYECEECGHRQHAR